MLLFAVVVTVIWLLLSWFGSFLPLFLSSSDFKWHHMARPALLPISTLEFKLQLYSKHLRGWNEDLSSGSPYVRERTCVSVAEQVKGHQDPGLTLTLDPQCYQGDQHLHPPDLIQRAPDPLETPGEELEELEEQQSRERLVRDSCAVRLEDIQTLSPSNLHVCVCVCVDGTIVKLTQLHWLKSLWESFSADCNLFREHGPSVTVSLWARGYTQTPCTKSP